MPPSIRNFWVDTDLCTGHFLCTDLAPLFFEMHDGGWAVAIRATSCEDLKPEEVDQVMLATVNCPTAAIKITLSTGEKLDRTSQTLKSIVAGHNLRKS